MSAAARARRSSALPFVKPQLATLVDVAPTGTQWVKETKYDGYRMQAHVHNGTTVLYSRNALDWSARFPEICDEITSAIAGRRAVLDGEVVVNRGRQVSFHLLQRALRDQTSALARFMVFDVLYFDGHDLRGQPLSARRELLEALMETFPSTGRVRISRRLRGSAASALTKACAAGGEGIICKLDDAPYTSGRGNSWIKLKCNKRQEMVIIGFSEPSGSREGIGALLLGVYSADKVLQYAGRVGTGFSEAELKALRKTLGALVTPTSPLTVSERRIAGRQVRDIHWVRPKLVAEVSFTEWTPDGSLRHPVFQGLREDKRPTDVRREEPA